MLCVPAAPSGRPFFSFLKLAQHSGADARQELPMQKKPLAIYAALFASGLLGQTSLVQAAEPSVELPTMVVSATGYKQEALRAPASITVKERDEIIRKPIADMAEVLRDIPGIDIVDSGVPGMKRLSLRGEESRRVLVKVNGQPIPDHSAYGSPLLIDANMIERIEVVRGSASVVHGSNAVGGVVNITTRQAAPGEQEIYVGGGYYSATRGHRSIAGILGANDHFDWRLQAARAKFGDRKVPHGRLKDTDSMGRDSDSEQKSVSAELGWRIDERQRIAWQGDYFKQEAKAYLPAVEGTAIALEFPKRDSKRNALSYSFEDEDALFHSMEARAYHQTGSRIMDNTVNVRVPGDPSSLIPMVKADKQVDSFTQGKDDLTTQGLQLTTAAKLFTDNNTVLGFEYQKDKLKAKKNAQSQLTVLTNPPMVNTPEHTYSMQEAQQSFWSLFAQQQIKFTDELEANIGARYYNIDSRLNKSTDRQTTSKSDNQLVGSASLVWQHSENSAARFNIAQGYTYPSLTQQFSESPGNGAINYGNPKLKAEKATTYELGWRHEGDQLTLDATLYHSRAKDFIDKNRIYKTSAGFTDEPKCALNAQNKDQTFCFEWVNASKAKTTGLEVMTAYQIENWRPYANLGIQKRRLEYGTGLKTWRSGLPLYQGRAGVQWQATPELELDFYARSYGKSRKQGYGSKGEAKPFRTSAYAEFNLAAYYQPIPKLDIAVQALNLTNRRYQNPEEIPAAGRAVDVEFRYRF